MKSASIKYFFFVFSIIILVDACTNNPEKKASSVIENDSCCNKNDGKHDQEVKQKTIVGYSEITCPNCEFKKTEILPTDVCQLAYTCEKCKTVMHPKEGDCCVFCTYGDHKCPSMQ